MTESGMGERERTHPTLALVEAAEAAFVNTIEPRLTIASSRQISTRNPIPRINEAPAIEEPIVQGGKPPAKIGGAGISVGLYRPSID